MTLKNSLSRVRVACLAMLVGPASAALTMDKVGGYQHDNDLQPLEVVAVKSTTNVNQLFVSSKTGLTIFNLGYNLSPRKIGTYNSTMDFGETTSVAYNPGYDELAFTVKAHEKLGKGRLYVVLGVERWMGCNCCEDYVQQLDTGYGPDMVTFTPNGHRILVANEGEPMDYLEEGNDPVGSVSIFKYDVERFEESCEVGFERFDETYDDPRNLVERGMRVGGVEFTTFSMDMEPEYITVTDNSRTAYVTLQENNAVAKINIMGCKVNRIFPLGYKDWSNGLTIDASDEDGDSDDSDSEDGEINLEVWPRLKGMYQPDAITTFKAKSDGKRYFLTANEGAPREISEKSKDDYYSDVDRAKDLAEKIDEDKGNDPDVNSLYKNKRLGRLEVTTMAPFTGEYDGDKVFDEVYTFGGRSISIFDGKTGNLVWDSGDFIATYIADPDNGFSEIFNSGGDPESFDDRSDKRGSEPEGLVMLEIHHRIYAFVALERSGGWMVWDVSDPTCPVFQSYTNSYEDDDDNNFVADVEPESGAIIPGEFSPCGQTLLIAAYEKSNTLAVFRITTDHHYHQGDPYHGHYP